MQDDTFRDAGVVAYEVLQNADCLAQPLKDFLYPELLRLFDELQNDTTESVRREGIGFRFDQLGDSRPGVGVKADGLPDILWVGIDGGTVTLNDSDKPLEVSPFYLARYPVTWAQYRLFLDAENGCRNPQWWKGKGQHQQDPHPAMGLR